MRKTLIIFPKHWQTYWIQASRLFQTTFSCLFSHIFLFISLTFNHLFFYNHHWFFNITSAKAQACINHSAINKNIVKVRVKHRRQTDMNTPFDWPRMWRQRTFQLADGTFPRQALCRSPDTGCDFFFQSQSCSNVGFFSVFWWPSQESLIVSSKIEIFKPDFASGIGLLGVNNNTNLPSSIREAVQPSLLI